MLPGNLWRIGKPLTLMVHQKLFIVHNEGITSVEVDRLKTLKSLQAPLDCFVE